MGYIAWTGVTEIEQAISHLSEDEKRLLFRDLAEYIENSMTSLLLEEAICEGDPMPWDAYREQRFNEARRAFLIRFARAFCLKS
jgi:hypothetical protein